MTAIAAPAPSFKRESSRLFVAALVTAAVSAATVKLIALKAGPAGMGHFSVFRLLGSLLTMTVGLGYGTILTRKMAAAGGATGQRDAFTAALALTALQGALFLVVALFGPALLTALFFAGQPDVGALELRVIVAMAFINLAMQNQIALLRADLDVTAQAAVNLCTALASLALISPLLRLGTVGLAANVGSGGLVGGVLATGVLFSRYPPAEVLRGLHTGHLRDILSLSPASLALAFPQMLLVSAFLWVTASVARGGMEAAGQIGAALLVSDAFSQIVLVSARSAAIARLARATDLRAEAESFRQASEFLISVAGVAAGGLVCAAPLVVILLYSRDFGVAPLLVRCFAVVFPLEAIWWMGNSALTARADFRGTAVLDTGLSVVLFALAALCALDGTLSPTEACLCIAAAKAALAGFYAARTPALPMGAALKALGIAAVLAAAVLLIEFGHATVGIGTAAAVSVMSALKLIGRPQAGAPR